MKKQRPLRTATAGRNPAAVTPVTNAERRSEDRRGIAIGVLIGMAVCAVLGLGVWGMHATGTMWLIDWIVGAFMIASIVLQGHVLGIPLRRMPKGTRIGGTEIIEQAVFLGAMGLMYAL